MCELTLAAELRVVHVKRTNQLVDLVMASSLSPARAGIVVAIAATAAFMLSQSPFEPVVWQNPTDLPALTGPLSPNERLLATEHLHDRDLIAPEAFAEGDDGSVYTGLWDGRVVRLDSNGENPRDVFFTGGVVSAAGRAVASSTGVDYGHRLMLDCHEKAKNKRLTLQDERECGRPLGVRWRAGKLYILDAYHGLFELDVAKGSAKHLINSLVDMPLPFGSSADAAAAAEETTLPLTFLNDFVFTAKGTIFLTDSSWMHPRGRNRREIIDGGSRGRLLRFEPKTGELRTMMCGLHFPNGIEIDPSEKKLLVVESMRFRILEMDLKSLLSKPPASPSTPASLASSLGFCGENESLPDGVTVFADALPGFVDGLEYDEKMGGYVGGVGTKVALPFSPLHLSLQKPGYIRTIIGKLIPIKYLDRVVPSYGLIIVVGLDGTITESMHDATGRTAFISAAYRHSRSGYTFLGSSQNLYLGRVRL